MIKIRATFLPPSAPPRQDAEKGAFISLCASPIHKDISNLQLSNQSLSCKCVKGVKVKREGGRGMYKGKGREKGKPMECMRCVYVYVSVQRVRKINQKCWDHILSSGGTLGMHALHARRHAHATPEQAVALFVLV